MIGPGNNHEKTWYIIGLIGKEILSAILWTWLIMACIFREFGTAVTILVLRALIWTVVSKDFRR